ncbi:MAG: TIGR03621 family F420-dependent LLM class oxidoreductase [Actinomycetota bacterium]|nr:TIGR03621 family F420-dependent LLM class oxidoreductase [Actinomycetota bacterium]MDA3006866.1 TIGR03621 family F420-dependent LLM class oxidoreductase [Actinomycetota bacterium]MDA3034261.1 TIGR03621 family F420-dependent LLM class oxidoreductase [Actinomycetota bacterium]
MAHPRPFRFGLMAAKASSGADWVATARKAEELGYSDLLMPDHYGDQLGVIPALTAAAAATTNLRVGSLVFANDFRHPALLAKDTATIDLLSDGRLEVGVGAGWMDDDYRWTGVPHDSAGTRISRMIEAIEVLRGLWGPEPFSYSGEHYTITEMNGMPKPVQAGGPPLIVGGGGKRVLSTAARLADIVGVNPNVGAGSFGPAAIASMSADATDEKLTWVRDAAGDRFDDLEISILKFVTNVTDDRDTVAEKVGGAMGIDAATILASPHTMVGSAEQIADELVEQRDRWQGSYVTVQLDAIDAFAPVVAALAGT